MPDGSLARLNPQRYQWLGKRGLAERYFDRQNHKLIHTYPGPRGQQPQIRNGRWTFKAPRGQLIAAQVNRQGPQGRLVHVWHPRRRVTFQGDDDLGRDLIGPPPPGGWSQCGSLWALGAVGLLAVAGAVGGRGSAARGPGGKFTPEWVATATKFIKPPWRYDKGMGGFIWRPKGGQLGDPGLQYMIQGGTGYGRGTWNAWVWAPGDESHPVVVTDGTQPWHALDAVKADYAKRADNPAANRGSQARKRFPSPGAAGGQLAAQGTSRSGAGLANWRWHDEPFYQINRKGSSNDYPDYPFYVVYKPSGQVVSGWDYREDALDAMTDDLAFSTRSAKDFHVLTAASVKRKYGAIKWASSGDETAHYR